MDLLYVYLHCCLVHKFLLYTNLTNAIHRSQVTVPEGSLCQLNSIFKVGLPPEAVFDILSDPGNKRVFKNIKVRGMMRVC